MFKKMLIAGLCIVSVIVVILAPDIGMNRSDSVNFKLYLHKPVKDFAITKGRYYVINYSSTEYSGLINKKVACLPNEIITRDNNSFYFNGELIATLSITHDKNGTPYPQYFPDKEQSGFFVVGDSTDSYDSRYFGLISKTAILREVTPIW